MSLKNDERDEKLIHQMGFKVDTSEIFSTVDCLCVLFIQFICNT